MINEERLMEIEIKLTRQEDLVDTLNQMVYRQQKKIGELEALCGALARHLKALAGNAGEATVINDKPPHY